MVTITSPRESFPTILFSASSIPLVHLKGSFQETVSATSHHGHGNLHYTDHSPSNSTVFFSGYPHPLCGAGISSMVFSIEPQRQDDYHESPNRQSLPSISEVIQSTEPGPYTFRPPSGIQTDFGLSPPFSLVRQQLQKTEKHPFLQKILPNSSFPLRLHALPVFSDLPQSPFTSLPSLLPASDCGQSSSPKAEIPLQHHHPEQQKTPEPHPPLSGVSSSRTILNCVEAYNRISREQHGTHLIPERLPTEWELSDMLGNMELIKRSLEHVKDLVQTSIQKERTHEGRDGNQKETSPYGTP
ncbi:hypothetical protein ACKAV7_008337 [Fusarium commune]